MRNHLLGFTFVVIALLSSCLPKREIANKRPLPDRSTPSLRNSTADAYIEHYKSISIREMELYGIPASITLAQALLESGSGNSYLARVANNHFGIKCASAWQGKTVLRNDDYKDECFRVYETAEASYRDHSEFLLRDRYAALFELDKNDYRGWAEGLKKAGYATNPKYAKLLISLIERYELYRYDAPEGRVEKEQRENEILKEIVEKAPEERIAAEAKPPVKMSIHEVRAGDTLTSVAKQYQLSAEEVRILNGLETNQLHVGQLLLVSR